VAHLFNPELFRLVRERWFVTQRDETFELDFFNVFDHGARAMLDQHPAFDAGTPASQPPHVLIVGLGSLGESLLVHLARRWWYLQGGNGRPLPVSVVDLAAQRKTGFLGSRYPALAETCAFTALDLEFPWADEKAKRFLTGGNGVPSVSSAYVCFDDDSLSLSAALSLHEHLHGGSAQVVVRMQEEAGLATSLAHEGFAGSEFESLHGFGLLDRTWTLDSVLAGVTENLARALHENYMDNRKKGILAASQDGEEVEGTTKDFLVSWDALPEDIRRSNRQQARAIRRELASIGCRLEPQRDWREQPLQLSSSEIDRLAGIEHDRWVAERKAEGWRLGSEKSPEQKMHPWLEAWDQLEDPKAKTQARADMSTLSFALAKVGFAVRRV
jgi:hypothetical protein